MQFLSLILAPHPSHHVSHRDVLGRNWQGRRPSRTIRLTSAKAVEGKKKIMPGHPASNSHKFMVNFAMAVSSLGRWKQYIVLMMEPSTRGSVQCCRHPVAYAGTSRIHPLCFQWSLHVSFLL